MLIEDESLMPDKVSTKVFIDDHDVKCDQAVSDYCFFLLLSMITAMVVGHNGNDGNDGGSFIMINIAIIIITIIHFYLSTADDISYPGRVAQHIGVNLVQSIQTEISLELGKIFFRKKTCSA